MTVQISKELIAFIAVLISISVLTGMSKLSQDSFIKILCLLIGGLLGWGVRIIKRGESETDTRGS